MANQHKYLQITAYVMLSVIFIFVIGIARNCSRLPSSPVDGYSGGDTIDIAMLYNPASYYFYDDTIGGINYDIASVFARQTDTPVKIWPVTDPASGLSGLKEGAFDILASLPLDNYIRKNFLVSESIFLDKLVLIQRADSTDGKRPVNSSLDLDSRQVYVAESSSAIQRLNNLADEIGGEIEVIQCPDMSDELLTLKVATGDYPLAVVNESVARRLTHHYPDLIFDNTVSFTQFQVWVFNPQDSVTFEKFNEWFYAFRSSDAYKNIIRKY